MFQGSLNYKVTELMESGGIDKALLFICILSFSLFFFKNLFRYLASFVLVFLRNGVVKDLRDALYTKIIELPLAYFSEKRKGDIISRMTADVQEVEVSFLTSLETIVREPLNHYFNLNFNVCNKCKIDIICIYFIAHFWIYNFCN